MAWIELHQSLPQHRKLLALRDALGLRTPAALGHMCLLWLWALDNAPDGDLSALPARQLAEICQFSERRAGDLAVALRTSGFVDADWRLHDWGDYTGRLIDQRVAEDTEQRAPRPGDLPRRSMESSPSGERTTRISSVFGFCSRQPMHCRSGTVFGKSAPPEMKYGRNYGIIRTARRSRA